MSPRNKIQQIESDHDLKKVKMEGIPVWIYIRSHFFLKLFEKKTTGVSLKSSNLISIFFSSFRGLFKWFKQYDYWFITGSNLRRSIDGKQYNILFDFPASQLEKALVIELPLYKHSKRNVTASKNLTSKGILILLETLYTKIFLRKSKIENQNTLEELQNKYAVKIPYIPLSKKMVAQYKVMKWILKYKKPKVIFINTSYTNFGYIKAFKEKNIPVIEFQHGSIGIDHYSYNIFIDFDHSFFPDYILTFGEQEKNVFKKPNQWKVDKKIIPIGSFIIENTLKNFSPDESINKLKKDFDYTFSVSLQETEKGYKLIKELIIIAVKNKNLLFIFSPRSKTEIELRQMFNLPKNIIFTPQLNVYEVILHSDYHITIYSTCALEAPSLGVKNILYNIDNKAYSYYKDVLHENTTFFVNNEEEFMDVVKNNSNTEKINIRKQNNNVIANNYFDNIIQFLDTEIKQKKK